MRDQIDVLLDKVDDLALRKELRTEVDRLRSKRSFGLVFESHLPERVRLPDHDVRAGVSVVLRDDPKSATYEVRSLTRDTVTLAMVREPDGTSLAPDDERRREVIEVPRNRVVVIADFGAPIHPGLRHLGSVERGGDKPSHVVIKGENHHVLEALQFTHAGKVDCIYIDPPYNTGARDWKYDNDYVDDTDNYRHSKWLAFMERRLLLAKKLLNPDDSVLIVAVDENEFLRLGLLLEQEFASSDLQAITVVSNRAGSARTGRFTRVEEYLFIVFSGGAQVTPWVSNMLADPQDAALPTVWFSATRNGTGAALRENRTTPVLFYPVHIDSETGRLHSVGEPLPLGEDRLSYVPPAGTVAVWPLSTEGREQTWRFSADRMREYFAAGTARLGRRDERTGHRPITYLQPGTLKNIEDGVFEIVGRTSEGALELALSEATRNAAAPSSVWNLTSHFARDHGSRLNAALIPGRVFPYPKSLYAVEDALRFFVKDKPNAVVLDFFGGSGTTAHAVARLNRQDGGRRQSILVTNNEVSADEAKAMRERGLYAGDPEWEALGIFEHVTRPRIEAAITGVTPSGEPVKGDYKFTDEFPMAEGFEENVEFCELTYLDPDRVELDLAFDELAPLLWLRAGAQGPILDSSSAPFAWTDRYGVLFDADRWRAFVAARPERATAAFVVTDSPSIFAGVASELPDAMDVVRLYESYLTRFSASGGR
jgi:adenine-specific DNA-methyltransferase